MHEHASERGDEVIVGTAALLCAQTAAAMAILSQSWDRGLRLSGLQLQCVLCFCRVQKQMFPLGGIHLWLFVQRLR